MAVTEAMKARRFEEIVLPHLHTAYNLARWLSRSDQDAQDIVQESYLRAFRYFDGCQGEDARAWLLAIVRNTTYTWLQQNRALVKHTPFDEAVHGANEEGSITMPDPVDNSPEAMVTRNDDKKRVNTALAQLPLEFREVLVLRELESLSYKEIAIVAEIPIGTVMSRLARGRKLLLECLERMN